MARYKITAEIKDHRSVVDISCITQKLLSNEFDAVSRVSAEQVSITLEEAIQQIKAYIDEEGVHNNVVYAILQILNKVQ